MNFGDKKKIVERCRKLKDYQYVHLFQIITSDSAAKYSKNNNGIFINLRYLSNDTLSTIDAYLSLIEMKQDTNASYESTTQLDDTVLDTPIVQNLKYEVVYHECYKKLSNFQKNLLKNQTDLFKT